jgi:hypothetical protein
MTGRQKNDDDDDDDDEKTRSNIHASSGIRTHDLCIPERHLPSLHPVNTVNEIGRLFVLLAYCPGASRKRSILASGYRILFYFGFSNSVTP